jgi:hypothetical protein
MHNMLVLIESLATNIVQQVNVLQGFKSGMAHFMRKTQKLEIAFPV